MRLPFRGPLLVISMICGGGALAAGTLAIRHAASKADTPEVVAISTRQAQAGTCEGYNLELAAAAAIQTRLAKHEEASRLLAMRQNCGPATAAVIRSAR
jgi:glutamate-1-semialdehyde aminotransferase